MKTLTQAETIEQKLFIYARPPYDWCEDELERRYGISVWPHEMEGGDRVLIDTITVPITIAPGINILTGMVDAMRERQSKIRAKAEVQCNAIEAQIQSMLAITHQPEGETP